MAITLDQVQQKQWDTYNKRSASLSDRLAEIEAYGKSVNPLVAADTAAVRRVAGERPIDVKTSQLIAGNETVNAQKSLSSDIANNDQLLDSLTKSLSSNDPNSLDNIYKLLQIKKMQTELDGTGDVVLKGPSNTKMGLLRGVFGASKLAEGLFNDKFTGPLDSILGTMKIGTNTKGSGDIVKFRQSLTGIETQIRNYISGAAVPEGEAKVLIDLIPHKGESDTSVKNKLIGLKAWAANQAQGILDTNNYEIDAVEYLNRTGAKAEEGKAIDKAGELDEEDLALIEKYRGL